MNIPVIKEPIRLPTDTPIYRYISESTVRKMFQNETIRFNALSSWNDKIEGFMFKKASELNHDKKIDIRQYFGNCWTTEINNSYFDNQDEYIFAKNEIEQDGFSHMWESYCKGRGVRIKSTIGKVLDLINENYFEIYHGLVYYKPLKLFSTGIIEKAENLFFYKKMNFIFENEYRFIIKPKIEDIYDSINIDITNFLDFIEELLIRPEKKRYSCKLHSLYKYYLNSGFEYEEHPYRKIINGRSICRISQLYGNQSHEN